MCIFLCLFIYRKCRNDLVYKTKQDAIEEAKRYKNFFYPDKLPHDGRHKVKFFRRPPVENVRQIGSNKWVLEKNIYFKPLKFKTLT